MSTKSKERKKAQVLDDLDETLTESSRIAAAMGDDFLVYLIDMAVLCVRRKALGLEDRQVQTVRQETYLKLCA